MKNSLVFVQFVILFVTMGEVNCIFKKSIEDGKTALEKLIMKKVTALANAPKNIPEWVSFTLIIASKFFQFIKTLLSLVI